MQDIKSTIDGYIEQIKQRCAAEGFIEIKELAFILHTSYKKIRNDIEQERLGMMKMGPEDSKCRIRIPETEALGYVLQFFTSISDLPPIEESPLFQKARQHCS